VQRKEYRDLVASAQDGRLAKEIAMSGELRGALLVVEGVARWTGDGELIDGYARWTRQQHYGLLWAVQAKGWWVSEARDANETVLVARWFQRWLKKKKHVSLDAGSRPGPVNAWGRATDEDWLVHLVSGLPGVGPERARGIVKEVGCPFAWRVSKDDLLKVEGLGPKTVDKIWKAVQSAE